MTTTLITGGQQGLGLETARQLIDVGHTVWIGTLDPGVGGRAARELDARLVELDVTSEESVRMARDAVAAGGASLDVLINNAGVGGGYIPVAEVTGEAMRLIYEVNVFGVVRVTQYFLPLLERSNTPVIVNVSSGMGSFGVTSTPGRLESTLIGLAYPTSKTALNMLTVMYAKAYPKLRVNAVDPGQTATDMTGGRGKTVEQGAAVIVAAAQFGPEDPSGILFDEEGPLPW